MAASHPPDEAPWVHGHAHEPNFLPPKGDGSFLVRTPDGREINISLEVLVELPYDEVGNCFIVSTGHGVSGPFVFGGVRLIDLVKSVLYQEDTQSPAYAADQAMGLADGLAEGLAAWQRVDVISADGFGARLAAADLAASDSQPLLLAYRRDGEFLSREQGLVRLIAPEERGDALRQVKWIARLEIG